MSSFRKPGKNYNVQDKSYQFSLKLILIYKAMQKDREYVLSRQLLRSGTAIGAMIRESQHAESRDDFIHKLSIALKEANETKYWLELMTDAGYFEEKLSIDLNKRAVELIKILIAILKSLKRNQ